MEKFLKDYIERVRPVFGRLPAKTAHVIASAFFSFKFELYPKTLRECTTALSQIQEDGGGNDAIKKALAIINAYAVAFESAQVRPDGVPAFTGLSRHTLQLTSLRISMKTRLRLNLTTPFSFSMQWR